MASANLWQTADGGRFRIGDIGDLRFERVVRFEAEAEAEAEADGHPKGWTPNHPTKV
jgi:hypothetical protein